MKFTYQGGISCTKGAFPIEQISHVLWLSAGNSLKAAANIFTIFPPDLHPPQNIPSTCLISSIYWRQVGQSEADFYILFTRTGTANVSWIDGRKQHGDGRCGGSALGWLRCLEVEKWIKVIDRVDVSNSTIRSNSHLGFDT